MFFAQVGLLKHGILLWPQLDGHCRKQDSNLAFDSLEEILREKAHLVKGAEQDDQDSDDDANGSWMIEETVVVREPTIFSECLKLIRRLRIKILEEQAESEVLS